MKKKSNHFYYIKVKINTQLINRRYSPIIYKLVKDEH